MHCLRGPRKTNYIFNQYLDVGAQNINMLIDGSGMNTMNTIAIQDLVRKLNGSGSYI